MAERLCETPLVVAAFSWKMRETYVWSNNPSKRPADAVGLFKRWEFSWQKGSLLLNYWNVISRCNKLFKLGWGWGGLPRSWLCEAVEVYSSMNERWRRLLLKRSELSKQQDASTSGDRAATGRLLTVHSASVCDQSFITNTTTPLQHRHTHTQSQNHNNTW